MLPKGHDIEVVGESFYQSGLRKAARASGIENGVRPSDDSPLLQAAIFREPNNQYDAKAVKVGLVINGQFEHVGYLARDTAAAFNPILRRFEKLGVSYFGCEASLIGGSKGLSFGCVLNIASKKQLNLYLSALENAYTNGTPNFRDSVDSDEFDDDPSSNRYENELDWEVPGWIK